MLVLPPTQRARTLRARPASPVRSAPFRAPPPALSALSAVRLRAGYRERLDDLEGRMLDGDVLQNTERSEVAAFEVLHGWRRALGVPLESVG